ncbi:hypothetical protein DRO59_08870 [Candidatus Bathyarchaeota archaeon]|nr:MAG: hypothetical protein DRO59_08870 [Candidatus Bathyarchaeota archaeon]
MIFTIEMKTTTTRNRRIRVLFHSLGLSCLGGAIFLQILVFTDILQHGYFMAVENNPAILAFEIVLTFFALIYFVYMYQRFIRSVR